MLKNFPEIIKELGVILTALLIPLIGLYKWSVDRKDKAKQREIDELNLKNVTNKTNINVLSKLLNLRIFAKFELFAKRIFKLFNADRFLILMAVNGKISPNKTTVIFSEEAFDVKNLIPPSERYVEVPIDDWYKKMLNRIEYIGVEVIKVSEMPNCILKDFYEDEGVVFSIVFFLKRYKLNEENDAILYSSIAMHKEEGWTNSTINIIISMTKNNILPYLDKIIR